LTNQLEELTLPMSSMISFFFAYTAIYVLVFQWSISFGAVAQRTEAVCSNTTLSWMSNSKGQSPCVVASYLLGKCSPTTWDVPAIATNQYYAGPSSPLIATDCLCSSVAYNLLSACGLCQGATAIITWPSWSTNCTQHVIPQGQWILAIPSGTSVPAWAYVTPDKMGGAFSPAVAQGFTSSPESTSTPTPTSSIPSPTGTGGSNTAPPSVSHTNVGAIVGGVIGGIAALILLGFLFFKWWKRRKEGEQQSTSLDPEPKSPLGAGSDAHEVQPAHNDTDNDLPLV